MYFGPVPRRWAHRRRLRAVFDPRCEVLTMDVNLTRRSAGSNLESLDPFSVAWYRGEGKASRLRAKKTKLQPSRGEEGKGEKASRDSIRGHDCSWEEQEGDGKTCQRRMCR
ncbi:unnamed protein product, partial [Ectocarpus sp. 4 AP-2014]